MYYNLEQNQDSITLFFNILIMKKLHNEFSHFINIEFNTPT